MKTTPVIENRKARYDYFVEDTLECGISLRGNEVKSVAEGRCNLKEGWCTVQNGQLVMRGVHIHKWDTANAFDTNELRERVLLVHKKEVRMLEEKISRDGMTLVPLSVYFSNGKVKVQIGICRGKKNYDKRECLAKKDAKRSIEKALKEERKW